MIYTGRSMQSHADTSAPGEPHPQAEADSSADRPTERRPKGGIKDTIESILIAFILAFVFRAFVVEAFVIPTGSMAPTLMGAHMRFVCDDCGYPFAVNWSPPHEAQTSSGELPIPRVAPAYVRVPHRDGNVYWTVSSEQDRVFAIYCPNCGYQVPRLTPQNPENDARSPTIHFGDRILVLKYMYLLQEPQRWDVVVFKSPHEPARHNYEQNYIKRLVGLPGEEVVIVDGDIFTRREGGEFEVARKTRSAQNDLWRVVYDNSYLPQGLRRPDGPFRQPWRATASDNGWHAGEDGLSHRFRFDGLAQTGTLEFDPTANPDTRAFTDYLVYNITADPGNQTTQTDTFSQPLAGANQFNVVSDLKLDLLYDRRAGEGPFDLELVKREWRFVARVEPGRVTLLEARGDAPLAAVGEPVSMGGGGPLHIEFSNVDYRVTVRIGGRDLIVHDYAPPFEELVAEFDRAQRPPLPRARITAANQQAIVSHVSLLRDIYYTNRGAGLRWAIPTDFPRLVVSLGPDEYFVLGDNSNLSSDARYWSDPINLPGENLFVESGRVPGRFMLGKAFFVYWPAGYSPFSESPVSFIPNFGKMRLIR